MRWIFTACIHFCLLCPLLAQDSLPDNARLLPEFTLRGLYPSRTGYTFVKSDSLPIAQIIPLSERLLWENQVFVRSIGPGALATLSIRGAGPNRSPIFWNGINLQSPMNGVMDLSLIPLWPDDRFELQSGGLSAALSSGAMGGSLSIVTAQAKMEEGFTGTLQAAAGSFARRETGASLGFSGERFSTRIRGNLLSASNDFSFPKIGLDGKEILVKQTNNGVRIADIQQFNVLNIGKKDQIKTSFWHQNAYREIPPTSTETFSDSWQEDRSSRLVLAWEHQAARSGVWTTQWNGMYDFLAFRLGRDVDTSISRQALLRCERSGGNEKAGNWRLGLQTLGQWAMSDGYADSLKWYSYYRTAAFASLEKRIKTWKFSLLSRQEWAENAEKPFTFSLGVQWDAGKPGTGHVHFSRNYNLPTFNDRYWNGLGNPDLKPEKGYSADLGWEWKNEYILLNANVFHLLLDHWILWQPDDSSGFFRPGNLRKVWSRGVELNVHWKTQRTSSQAWRLEFSAHAQCARATQIAVYDASQEVLGRQLPYTPTLTAGSTVKIVYKNAALAYLHQYSGQRRDVVGKSLPGYQTGNLLIFCTLWKRWTLDFRLENCWNERYEVIRYRPMPGRNWRLGLRFNW